ncbi:MAG: class B sortase [Oscillospiraceae bacterium]|nr:class B sortase [Oscillospiraceae bacterium]
MIRKSVFLVASLTLIVTSIYLIAYFLAGAKQDAIIDDARVSYSAVKDSTDLNGDGTYSKFNQLLSANNDFIGWLNISGARVDNPVYKTTDNDYYISHNMNKENSAYGALFVDYRTELSATETSQNTVIYGHHMKNGSMFGTLKKYRDLSFYKQNPTLTFDTLYKTGEYKIFAVFITNTLPEQDNGKVFNYRPNNFGTQDAFLTWINEIKARSLIDTPVDIIKNDEILTLSTCIYDFDDARLVVMARRVRDDENATINISEAVLNADAIYPAIWYIKKGLTVPDTSVTSTDTSSESVVIETNADTSSLTSSTITSSIESSSTTSSIKPPSSSKPAASAPASSETAISEPTNPEPASSETPSVESAVG